MANDAAPLKAIAGSLEHQALDPIFSRSSVEALRGASTILQDHEAKARKVAEERFDAALRHYIEHPKLYAFGGFCNLVGCLATLCGRMTDTTPEDSEAEADWLFAEQVMDAALNAVDLNYGERSNKKAREKALAAFKELVEGIKA